MVHPGECQRCERLETVLDRLLCALGTGAGTCGCSNCERIAAKADPITCKNCGYVGQPATLECECYDENRYYCRPDARGAGCPHGFFQCPICADGEAVAGWRELRPIIEDARALFGHGDPRPPKATEERSS